MMYVDAEGDRLVHSSSSGWHYELSTYNKSTSKTPVIVQKHLIVDGCRLQTTLVPLRLKLHAVVNALPVIMHGSGRIKCLYTAAE